MQHHAIYFEGHYNEFVAMLVGFNGMAMPEFRHEAMRLRSEHETLLRSILVQGVAEGTFAKLDPIITGRAVLSLLNWMVRWFRPGGVERAEGVATEYYNTLIGGIARKA